MSTATKQVSYSKRGAAAATGVSEQTIARAIKAGRLRAKRSALTEDGEAAGSIIIRAVDLDAWVDGLPDA